MAMIYIRYPLYMLSILSMLSTLSTLSTPSDINMKGYVMSISLHYMYATWKSPYLFHSFVFFGFDFIFDQLPIYVYMFNIALLNSFHDMCFYTSIVKTNMYYYLSKGQHSNDYQRDKLRPFWSLLSSIRLYKDIVRH